MNISDASITGALSLGFVLGLRHALDSDHIVAVSAIVSEHKSLARSSLVGTFWGLGHTASLFAVGLIILVLKISIPDHVKPWMEMPVALMLIALGVNATFRAAREHRWQIHTHVHSHDQQAEHAHLHLHNSDGHDHEHRLFRLGRRPFVVGLIHGFAGSAAVTLAALATVPTIALGLTWIAVFGIGSIGGMLLMSAAISLPFIVTARRFSVINGAIRLIAGLFSIAFGVMIAWSLLGEIGRSNS